MKKKLILLTLLLLCTTVLTGCFCQHEWKEATCTAPKTCAKCGKTEGEPIAHSYYAATCEKPKTCQICGAVEGEALGHDWKEATCTEAKTCSVCGKTEGEALGHTWMDATTEAPKTCANCGLTEGEPIVTDSRFTSAAAAPLLGKWGCTLSIDGEMMGLDDFPDEVSCVYLLDFGNAGELGISVNIADEDAFKESLVQYTMASTYAEFEDQGMDAEAADAAVEESYGLSMEEFVRKTVSDIDMNGLLDAMFSALNIGGVYYVEEPYLYTATDWDAEMDYSMFVIDSAGALHINSFSEEMGLENFFTRVTE